MDSHDLETLRQSIDRLDRLERKIDFLYKQCDVAFEDAVPCRDEDDAIKEWKASAEQWKDAIEGWSATDPSETVVYDPDDEVDEDVLVPQKPAAWRPNVNNGLGKYFRKQRFEE